MESNHGFGWGSLALGVAGSSFAFAPITQFAFPLALSAGGVVLLIAYLFAEEQVSYPIMVLAVAFLALAFLVGVYGLQELEDIRAALDAL